MGFRKNSWCTVWSVEPVSDTMTKGRITVSHKNKDTDQYDQDFNGFVAFFGTSTAKKAARLKEKERIKLGDVDVRSYYNKETEKGGYNFNIYSFQTMDEANEEAASANGATYVAAQTASVNKAEPEALDGASIEEVLEGGKLPF